MESNADLAENNIAAIEETKYCIHCHWVGTSHSGDIEKVTCFAPANVLGKNLVDGSTIFKERSCIKQRYGNQPCCGIEGKWFKKKELPPVMSYRIEDVTIGGQSGTNLELVRTKPKAGAIKRLTKEDLENI